MTRTFSVTTATVTATLGLALSARAFPHATGEALRPHACQGLFGKLRLPNVNVRRAAKAVVYPVKKTAIAGGKAAVEGYQVYRVVSPRGRALPAVPNFK